MAEASRDQNSVPTLLGVSYIDSDTPVLIFADPATGRLFTSSTLTDGTTDVGVTTGGQLQTAIRADDTPSIDAFGRWRVSHPDTIFDSKNIFDDDGLAANVENQPLLFDNQETSGGGTSTAYNANESSQTIAVSATTAGTRVRQTRMRFNYQPGKSQLVMMTATIGAGGTGITGRVGLFDANDGLFFESDDGVLYVTRRTSTSGTPVDNRVAQANWNVDTMDGNGASGITIDPTKTQILWIDYEWLGVGRVRMGFVIDGKLYTCHQFLNTNNLALVYMKTPNLPIRYEISNDGTGAAGSIDCICASVISEGGSQDLGITRYASTAGTQVATNAENTMFAVLGIRLKAEYLGATIKILNAALQLQTANITAEWALFFNPTVAGTFTYADQANSAVQIAKGATTNTVTNGIQIAGGFIESTSPATGSSGSGSKGIDSALRLGSIIDGTPDTIVLAVRPVGGDSTADFEGSLTWRELV